jgi:hypothetical protein
MEGNQSHWSKSFSKSLAENSQLVFSKKLTASVIDTEDNTAINEILDIESIEEFDSMNNSAIMAYIDNRTHFYKCLSLNSLSYLSIYFPMSREKYKLTCLISSISGDGKSLQDIPNKEQINVYLKKNLKQSQTLSKENIDERDHLTMSDKYIKSFYDRMKSINQKEVLNNHWTKLESEEKLNFAGVHPDSIKLDIKLDDVDKFECQEELTYNKNFTVLYFFSLDVEHSIYPMPQVVANSRKPNFESLYKPHRKLKKYYFLLNLVNLTWTVKELNA